jgi:hypothetical protein
MKDNINFHHLIMAVTAYVIVNTCHTDAAFICLYIFHYLFRAMAHVLMFYCYICILDTKYNFKLCYVTQY